VGGFFTFLFRPAPLTIARSNGCFPFLSCSSISRVAGLRSGNRLVAIPRDNLLPVPLSWTWAKPDDRAPLSLAPTRRRLRRSSPQRRKRRPSIAAAPCAHSACTHQCPRGEDIICENHLEVAGFGPRRRPRLAGMWAGRPRSPAGTDGQGCSGLSPVLSRSSHLALRLFSFFQDLLRTPGS